MINTVPCLYFLCGQLHRHLNGACLALIGDRKGVGGCEFGSFIFSVAC